MIVNHGKYTSNAAKVPFVFSTKSCSDDPDYSYVLALMHPQGNWNVNFQVPQWTIHGLW